MKEILTHFEKCETLSHIDVTLRASEHDAQIEHLLQLLAGPDSEMIMITDSNNVTNVISAKDIIRLCVRGKIVNIYTEDGEYETLRTLQSIEHSLDPERFIRISRQEIVNLCKVRHFDFSLGGTLCLTLSDGTETWASRRCIPIIRKRISGKE